jgi:hypothetical protein
MLQCPIALPDAYVLFPISSLLEPVLVSSISVIVRQIASKVSSFADGLRVMDPSLL